MAKIAIFLVRMYQKTISKYIKVNRSCRFYPTCSEYSIQAFEKYGFIKGLFLSSKRILRCNPFSKGGYDPLIWRGVKI